MVNIASCLNPRSVVRLVVTPHLSYNRGWGDNSAALVAPDTLQKKSINPCWPTIWMEECVVTGGRLLPAPEELLLEGVLLEIKAGGISACLIPLVSGTDSRFSKTYNIPLGLARVTAPR